MNLVCIRKSGASRRGMALLMVLAIIVLISALIIGFLLSTSTELKSSQSYASGAATRHLSDSAVQLVMAQIADATKGTQGSATLSWASQPGMIRTYNQSGNPEKYYKLYSSDALIVDGTGFSAGSETPPANWDAMTGLFTDLNAPITRDGKVHFPIIDPRAKSSDPSLSVEGFDYATDVQGVVQPGGGSDAQRLPMPVRWLYVLQDGKFATPVSSSNGVVSFDTSDASRVPSSQNPIVGRIAYWTDDDTSKININTASEGTFWDRPWANNTTEQSLATAIPAQNEFQRYPGHPAKTSLSTVLGPLLKSPSPAWYQGISSSQLLLNQNQLKAYYDLAPRVADGGTRGGSVSENDANGNPNPTFQAIRPDSDRLYASLDEFFFSPVFTSGLRTLNNAAIDNGFIERSKFFLTAHSRAPELNLFGKPRVTLWPLQADPTLRNVKDKLIAFCSEIGGNPYYIQRLNVYGGQNPSSQSSVLDWTGVPRNEALYRYLDNLTQQNVPGYGGSFSSKYPNSRQQIITEMVDQIRSGVNAYSTDLLPKYSYAPNYLEPGSGQVVPLVPPAGSPGAGTHGFGRFPTIAGAAIVFYRINNAYYTTTGTGADTRIVIDSAQVTPENPNGVVIQPAAQIGATLILNPMTVSPGFPPWSPNVQYEITGLDKFTINGNSMGFPSTAVNRVSSRIEYSGQANVGPFFGTLANFRYSMGTGGDANKTPWTSDPSFPESQYAFTVPLPSAPKLQLPDGATSFDFNSDTLSDHIITIKIYAGSDTNRQHPIQTIDMEFPIVPSLPVPTAHPTTANPIPNPAPPATPYFNRFAEPAPSKTLNKHWRQRLVQSYPIPSAAPYTNIYPSLGKDTNDKGVLYWVMDVARGVTAKPSAVAQGDYRVYAALSHVPASFFTPSPGYNIIGGTRQLYGNAQSLRDGGLDGGPAGGFGYDASIPGNANVAGSLYPHYTMDSAGSDNGRGVLGITAYADGLLLPKAELAAYGGANGRGSNTGDKEYRGSARPAVPPGLAAAYLSNGSLGDWDNATGLLGDGPFINKPDEGNSATVSDTTSRTGIDVFHGTKEISGGYFSTGVALTTEYSTETGKTFSPNRQIASAVLFGSLPTGIDPTNAANTRPWQTLLFSPNPLAKANHPGRATPPDHLFLDLFTMPIVEPYAISEPFSTAGKVNMNYQIMPFSYIKRDTGVRAVLKASRITAIPQSLSTVTSLGPSYKDGQRARYEFRWDINPDRTTGTLAGFEQKFNADEIFRSASEICDIFLVPKQIPALSTGVSYPPGSNPPASYAATADWWDNFLLTGDNTREAPYGDIYARLTTKSNTYTVHYRVQSLKKVRSTPANQWVEGKDQSTGEIRGSATVERYIDMGNPNLPDFAATGAPSAEEFYKIRTIGSSVFNP